MTAISRVVSVNTGCHCSASRLLDQNPQRCWHHQWPLVITMFGASQLMPSPANKISIALSLQLRPSPPHMPSACGAIVAAIRHLPDHRVAPSCRPLKQAPRPADHGRLQDLFGRCGDVARLVLPGTRTLALVDFRERSAALHAFRTLAYKAFHHAPLLLEWAPAGIFTAASPPPATVRPPAAGPVSQC